MANRHTTKSSAKKSASSTDGAGFVIRVVKVFQAHRANVLMTVPKDVSAITGIVPGTEVVVKGTKNGFTVQKVSADMMNA